MIDGGFEEGGNPNIFWDATTDHPSGALPFCDFSCDDFNYGYEGDWWVWFGGWDISETASVSQSIVIPPGTYTLSFYVTVDDPESGGSLLTVTLDGETIFSLPRGDFDAYADGYVRVEVDVSGWADGQPHELKFAGYTEPVGDERASIYIDNVSVDPS